MESTNIKLFALEDFLPIVVKNEMLYNGNMYEEDETALYDIDFDDLILENVSEEKRLEVIKRNRRIVSMVKKACDYQCQICGQKFMKDDGSYYCEAHHIIPISENGTQAPENVIVLCANHHRMFHYAKNRVHIGAINDNKRVIQIDGEKFIINLRIR